MKEPIDPRDPEFTRRLMPALRMLVRFPLRTLEVVSFETNIELSDIELWVETHGRPGSNLLAQLHRYLSGRVPKGAPNPLAPRGGAK